MASPMLWSALAPKSVLEVRLKNCDSAAAPSGRAERFRRDCLTALAPVSDWRLFWKNMAMFSPPSLVDERWAIASERCCAPREVELMESKVSPRLAASSRV